MNRRNFLLAVPLLAVMARISQAAERADLVVVEKGARRLLLLREGRTLRSYSIALGFDPAGHKMREGDGRTPEGLYEIDFHVLESDFHRALKISYPNAWDRRRAEMAGENPGGGIMIHGLPDGKTAAEVEHGLTDWTNGCIAVIDREIEELMALVPVGTPVVIRK